MLRYESGASLDEDNGGGVIEMPAVLLRHDSATSALDFAGVVGSSRRADNEAPASCPICYECFHLDNDGEDEDLEAGNGAPRLQQIQLSCGHAFCLDCLQQHLMTSIEEKQVPLECPHIECCATVSSDFLEILFQKDTEHDDGTWKRKYEKLVRLKQNPLLRECTRCSFLIDPEKQQGNDLVCDDCGHGFCKEHGDLHSGMLCGAFLASDRGKAQQESLDQSEAAIRLHTKECTRCGALLQKSDGCDYVKCGNCRGDFCYKCGTHEFFVKEGLFQRCSRCDKTIVFRTLEAGDGWGYVVLYWLFQFLWFLLLLAIWMVTVPLCILCFICIVCCVIVGDKNASASQKLVLVLWILFYPFLNFIDTILEKCFHQSRFFAEALPPFETGGALADIPVFEPTRTISQ
ncbi:MAG: hypothetical protein SGILL_003210 [Bacillariaceae sp.]